MKNNKGYSLVEMIIVIGIIALMSTLAFISVTIVNSARARDTALNFDNEVAALAARAKSMKAGHDEGGVTYNEYCLVIYNSGNTTHITQGYWDSVSGSYVLDANKDLKVSSRVNLKFEGTAHNGTDLVTYTGTGMWDESNTDPLIITYNLRGECTSGYGIYRFYKNGSSTPVVANTVRKNGSHETK